MERAEQHAVDFLTLSTAAAVVYDEIMEGPLKAADAAEMNAVLQDVATALSNVAPIYSFDPHTGRQKQLETVDLLFGVFQRGATIFRTPKQDHENLAIRRADMRAAIAVFRNAGVKFHRRVVLPNATALSDALLHPDRMLRGEGD